jgi:hypothetical protein
VVFALSAQRAVGGHWNNITAPRMRTLDGERTMGSVSHLEKF